MRHWEEEIENRRQRAIDHAIESARNKYRNIGSSNPYNRGDYRHVLWHNTFYEERKRLGW